MIDLAEGRIIAVEDRAKEGRNLGQRVQSFFLCVLEKHSLRKTKAAEKQRFASEAEFLRGL
jgi:hypothetical protein